MTPETTGSMRKTPGPDHPIEIEPAQGRVTVTFAGQVVADSRRALTLREASYPPVFYIPREDIDMAVLAASPHTSFCPYKGEASYYGAAPFDEAAWSYEKPYPAVAEIAGHLAFYPDRVDAITLEPAA